MKNELNPIVEVTVYKIYQHMSLLRQPTYQSVVKTLNIDNTCISSQNQIILHIKWAGIVDKLKRENHLQPRRRLGAPPQREEVGAIEAPNNT